MPLEQNESPQMTSARSRPLGPTRWLGRRFLTICFAVFAFEVGIFLTVFPWLDSWVLNHLPVFLPSIEILWDDPRFKGAISGLGLVNVYVSVMQVLAMIRGR